MNKNTSLIMTGCNIHHPSEKYAWGPGIHKDYVIHYILKGRGYFETGNKKYYLNTGESFIIYPENTVKYYPDKCDPWEYTWVNFNGTDAEQILSMTGFSEHPVAPACKEARQIFDAFSPGFQQRHILLKNSGLLQILLALYIDIYPARKFDDSADYISHAKQYISANFYRHSFNVTELSYAIGIERSYLYRLFMDKEGMSPVQYIINTRLENAAQMFKNGADQVKLVSYSVGYDNPLYFSNSFKKKYGISPKKMISKNKTGL